MIKAKYFFSIYPVLVFLSFFLASNALAINCPQHRLTQKAPLKIYNKKNPLELSKQNIAAGKELFEIKARPLPCKNCHGLHGDGRGPMAFGLNPSPRDFTCAQTIDGVPDGQLFWIIKNGSFGTGMPAFKDLKDNQIWQVILYIRQLAKTRVAQLAFSGFF